jgi:hypothetical protein
MLRERLTPARTVMPTMFVTAYQTALNFRSSPEQRPDNLIGSLFLLQPVETTGPAQGNFLPCRATVGGQVRDGFASQKFLRPPTTPNREALLAQAHREYMRFQRGLGKEHLAPFAGFVGEMWKALGNHELDGTDTDVAWSAAAISFMVRNAGPAYARFRFAQAHSKFTHAAIRARDQNDKKAPFWGFRLFETKPQIGDIVVRDNPNFAPAVDFDVARLQESYRSHSDIVVHIDSEKNLAVAIGGNLSDSVSLALYDLGPGDFLAPTRHTFALLRNRTDGDV